MGWFQSSTSGKVRKVLGRSQSLICKSFGLPTKTKTPWAVIRATVVHPKWPLVRVAALLLVVRS